MKCYIIYFFYYFVIRLLKEIMNHYIINLNRSIGNFNFLTLRTIHEIKT